jgi:type I restriction enzyme S subunit
MTARRFNRYPAYKDSGVEWLGEIPAGWETVSLKRVASIRYGLGEPPKLLAEGLPFVRATNVTKGRIVDRDMQCVDPADVPWNRNPALRTGDIIVVRSGAYTGDSAIIPEPYDGAIAGYDMVVRVWRGKSKFLAWALLSRYALAAQIELASLRAAQPHLNAEELGTVAILFPPDSDQRAIAAFLDRETARIDALVAKKERLIALLQERRTALITRAVTKGLDPTVPMKDSGVEWLGEIPAHWEVAPVYARYEVALGKMLDAKRVTGEFSGLYLRNVDVQWDRVNTEGLPEMDFAPWERDRYLVRPGDLLVCEGGEVGRTAIWRGEIEECFYQKALHRVRPRAERDAPRFFFYLMYMVAKRGVFAGAGNQNTIDHLTAIQLKHYRFPFASEPEQRAIATFLDHETARIDALVAKVHDALERLKELRTAIISAAVTGKIDVREETS